MFAELSATSSFTFLTGASQPEEYMERAAALGLSALAIADENSVAGIVRAHVRAREIARQVAERAAIDARQGLIGPPLPPHLAARRAGGEAPGTSGDGAGAGMGAGMSAGMGTGAAASAGGRPAGCGGSFDIHATPRLIPAARLVLREDGLSVTALPLSRRGWAGLCRIITAGRRRAEKGRCVLRAADLLDHAEALHLLLHPPAEAMAAPGAEAPVDARWMALAHRLAGAFEGRMHLLMAPVYDGEDAARFARLERLASRLGLAPLASALPIMHHGRRRRLADVLTAIRTGRRVTELGRDALANAEQRLRSEVEMGRIFAGHEGAVEAAGALAGRLAFSLDELRHEYPSEVAAGESPTSRLRRLAHAGLDRRYPEGAPARVRQMMARELDLIGRLGYAPYFLTVNDIVAFARARGIFCQGRGSAANSVVCYALGITEVSPEIGAMVFERFVSEARGEPPDIDVDFEHERREEVIQHIYERYGRHRAGLCATVIHYRARRAIREVGRAMGLSEDTVAALSSQVWGLSEGEAFSPARLREIGLDPADPHLRQTLALVREIVGFPRHLSQHVGGFVITEGRLDELCPVENAAMEDRTVISWDKDDIDALGILKVDILALGMLTCLRKSFELMARHLGLRHDLSTLPPEDPRVYDMLCRADTVGVFQVESRAQMNFLPRMRPRCFYDLVIEVAIIRPGPIQGDMVHPYIRRRNGEEEVAFPSDALGEVLGKTLGVPLFQEQAMQIAIVGAGFTPEEADRLRRALATFRRHGDVSALRGRFLRGMKANGHDEDFAARCFAQIEGFGSYGFPESHAASFALLVYASAWIKCHHPGIFACALLNSQPMGFYAPAQIVRDARAHGVEVRPVCINASYWDNVMEPDGRGGLALRLGFRQIRGMAEEDAAWIAAARGNGYTSLEDVWRRAGVAPAVIARLAEADAFAGLGMSRRAALWAARALTRGGELPLFARDLDGEGLDEPPVTLPPMSLGEAVVEDYVAMRLSLRAHPLALLRKWLTPGAGGGPEGRPSPQQAPAQGPV